MKGLAFAFVVLFVAFCVVYNVDGSWLFSFVESLGSLRGDSFFVWARESLAQFAVSPFDPNADFWENLVNGVTYIGKLLLFPVQLIIAFVQYLLGLIEIAFSFFPHN